MLKQNLWIVLLCIFVGNIAVGAKNVPIPTEPRHYEEVDTSFYNANIFSLNDNLYDRYSLADKATAENLAKRYADLGLNVLIYNGRHFRLNYPDEWNDIAKNTRIVVGAFHKFGIKVIEHHDFTIFTVRNYKMMLEHLDWLQEDIRTGEKYKWVCPNNKDWLKFYSEYLKRFQKITKVDGYMLDEIALASYATCGCKYCRAKYGADTGELMGYTVPTDRSFGNSSYRNIIRWKSRLPAKAQSYLLNQLRSINSRTTILTYCSDYSDSRIASRGIRLSFDAAMYSSFVGWEVMIADCLQSWRPWLRALKMRLSYANYYDIPVWSLNREQNTKRAIYFAWALSQAGKHSIWYPAKTFRAENIPYVKKFIKWKQRMPHRWARCLTDTGFLLSDQTRFTNPKRSWFWYEAMGWADMFINANHQFDVLLDGDLENKGRLGKYNVLFLIAQSSLTHNQCNNLSEWVARGGTAVLTSHTSLYDEFGNRLKDFRLAEQMGIHFDRFMSPLLRIKGKMGDTKIDCKLRMRTLAIKSSAQTRVLVSGFIGGDEFPIITETKYGNGRFIYVASDLGSENVEVELRNGSQFRTRENPDKARLIRLLYKYAHSQSNIPIKLKMPSGVHGVAYQLLGGVNKGRVYIHLINTKGKRIKVGDRVYYGRPEDITFPEIGGKIVIEYGGVIKGPITIESPMMDKPVYISVSKSDSKYARVEVPGHFLKRYLLVRFDSNVLANQIISSVPLCGGNK